MRWKNPKKKGGLSFDRYEGYKHAKTYDEYLKLGGTRADFKWDGVRGYIHVHRKMGPAGTPPGFGGSVEALADAPLDEWLAANPMINMAHAAQRQKLETAACKAYAAKTLEWWEDRVKSGTGGPEGARALERMLPYWEAHSSFDMSRVEDAAHVLHTLAHEYAQYARVHEDSPDLGEKEMMTITDLAREVHLKVSKGHHAHLVEALKHLRASQMVTPKNYKQAMRGDFREYWEKAVATEVENLTQHRVFQWVPRPPGKHLIDSNWAWKVKTNDLGQISKFKARLVARGFRQVYGIDYADTMAPVGKLTSFRMLLAETARRGMDISFVDIRSAYLKGDLKIKQYMTPPRGVVPPRPGLVMRLDKGLYGLKQSGRRWNERFNLNLLSWGFKVSAADPCLYVKSDGDSEIRVLLFVDDMAIMSDSDAAGQGLRDALIQAVKDEGYEYSSSDDDDVYLGMAVKRINATSVLLTQERYVRDVMMKFKTADGKSFTDSRRTCSPSPGGKISKRDCPTGDPQSNPEGTRFREICGVLRWIETCTRPDISAALGELSKVQSNPGQVHVEMLDHLMRYVHTTAHHGLLYGGKKQRTADDVLVGYVDSNWAGDCDNYQTRGGYIFTAWQSPVSWASYKFTAVAASSCESEYMSASRAVREASWLRYLLSDLGYGDLTTTNFGSLCDQDFVKVHLSDLVDKSEMPMAVFCDNKAAVAISKNPVLHKRSKHINIAFHIVRRECVKGHVVLAYIPTKENIADMLTKALTRVPQEHLAGKVMAGLREGKVVDVSGKPLEWEAHPPTRDKLYASPPAGLTPSKGDEPNLAMRNQLDLTRQGSLARGASVVGSTPDADSSRAMAAGLARSVLQQCMSATSPYNYAIVDSGASFTYACGRESLTNTSPGIGYVRVANGESEKVGLIGQMGPLGGVRQVTSFQRTLVSVKDLVEQFGPVLFNNEGVYLASTDATGHSIITRIGSCTPERLYSFDIAALTSHSRKSTGATARAKPK